jgi:hypothetical protein
MVAELVPQKELQPRAFTVMPLVWNLGSVLGPSMGGALAKPAKNMPGLFGDNKFLIKFPFLLPNLVNSGFFLVGITTGLLFLHVGMPIYSSFPISNFGRKLLKQDATSKTGAVF